MIRQQANKKTQQSPAVASTPVKVPTAEQAKRNAAKELKTKLEAAESSKNLSSYSHVKRANDGLRPPAPPLMADVLAVFDRSGSMGCMAQQLYNGALTFVSSQKDQAQQSGIDTKLTLMSFDDKAETIPGFDGRPIAETPDLDTSYLHPRGTTRLVDTFYEALTRQSYRNRKARENLPREVRNLDPELRRVAALLTDGADNQSTTFTPQQLNHLITKLRSAGVVCMFLGANQDAVRQGAVYGFGADHSMTYTANGNTAQCAMRSMTEQVSRAVSGSNSTGFSQLQRTASHNPQSAPSQFNNSVQLRRTPATQFKGGLQRC